MNKQQLKERIKKFAEKRLKEMSTGAGATSGFQTGTGYQHQGKKPKNETKQKIFQKPPKDGVGVPTVFTKGTSSLKPYTSIGYREVKPSEMIDAKYLWAGKGGLPKTKIKESVNPTDTIKTDVPLFIRLLEYAREDAKTDMDLHNVTENIIRLSSSGKTLTMSNYDNIVKKENLNESRYSQFKKQTEIVKPSTQMQRAVREIKKKLQEANKIVNYTKQLKTELSETNQVEYNKRTESVMNQLMREIASLYQSLKEIKRV
jgi:hypothetical protein